MQIGRATSSVHAAKSLHLSCPLRTTYSRLGWHSQAMCCCACLSLSELSSSLIGRSLARRPTSVAVAKNGWGDDEDKDSLAALYCDFSWANSGALFDLILSPLVTDLYNDLNIEVRSVLICVPAAFSSAAARVLFRLEPDRPIS
eukprot:COSAG02_NODE_540_length_20599_cov_14.046339_4_plen_144_part_00